MSGTETDIQIHDMVSAAPLFAALSGGAVRSDEEVAEYEARVIADGTPGRVGAAGFPKKFRAARLADLDARQREAGESFLRRVRDKGQAFLWLCGSVGTGKSALAAAIGGRLCAEGRSVQCVQSHVLTGRIRSRSDTLSGIQTALRQNSLVVFEEVGRYPEPAWESYYLFALIDCLYGEGVSLILVSNLMKNELGAFLGAACVDRFKGIAAAREFTGASYRGSPGELYAQSAE